MCRHCSADPSFRGFDLRVANARLGWFSPLGVAFRFGDCRSASWPSGSRLPLFGTHRFGVAARRVGSSAFRFGDCRSAGWPSGSRLPLFGTHRFGVAARRVGASAFRFGVAAGRVDLRAHGFRFLARAASELPLGGLVLLPSASGLSSAGWPSDSPLPLFGTHRFGITLGELALLLGGLALPPSASEIAARRVGLRAHASVFRHAPLQGCRWAGWPSDSPLPLFGMRRSVPPRRRSEGRRSAPTRHLFHSKTLIPTC